MNEDPTDKLIRELQEENEKLKKMLESGEITLPSGSGEGGIEAEEGMTEAGIKTINNSNIINYLSKIYEQPFSTGSELGPIILLTLW